jgi:hypothetical protein
MQPLKSPKYRLPLSHDQQARLITILSAIPQMKEIASRLTLLTTAKITQQRFKDKATFNRTATNFATEIVDEFQSMDESLPDTSDNIPPLMYFIRYLLKPESGVVIESRNDKGFLEAISSYVLISYAHEDQVFVGQLAAALESKGVYVWWDSKPDDQIPNGAYWADYVSNYLTGATHVLVVASQASINSEPVKEEIDYAKVAKKKLLVVRTNDQVPPPLHLSARIYSTYNGSNLDSVTNDIVHAIHTSAVTTELDTQNTKRTPAHPLTTDQVTAISDTMPRPPRSAEYTTPPPMPVSSVQQSYNQTPPYPQPVDLRKTPASGTFITPQAVRRKSRGPFIGAFTVVAIMAILAVIGLAYNSITRQRPTATVGSTSTTIAAANVSNTPLVTKIAEKPTRPTLGNAGKSTKPPTPIEIPTLVPTDTPTETITPSPVPPTDTATATATNTATNTDTPTFTPTATPTIEPTNTREQPNDVAFINDSVCVAVTGIKATFAKNDTYRDDEELFLVKTQRLGDISPLGGLNNGLQFSSTQLTVNTFRDRNPVWSPNGMSIVYEASADGKQNHLYKIDLSQLASGGTVPAPVDLTDSSSASCPNGKCQDNVDAAFSPDGTKIAFASNRTLGNGNFEIWTMDVNGGNVMRITNRAGDDRAPSWSPDGSRIAFESVINNQKVIQIVDATQPDSQPYVFIKSSGDNFAPKWSRDGTKIAFLSTRNAQSGQRTVQIFVVNADGSDQHLVTPPLETLDGFSWMGDSKHIIISFQGLQVIDINDPKAPWTHLAKNVLSFLQFVAVPDINPMCFVPLPASVATNP